MKKIVCFILTVVLAVCSATSVYAAELSQPIDEEIDLQYLYTYCVTSALAISSSKTATCSSSVEADSSVTKITITQELQKRGTSSWKSIKGFGKTVFNQPATALVKTYEDLDSGTYRVKTIAKVYSGSNSETIIAYSKTVTC